MYKILISIEKYLNLPSLMNFQNLSFAARNDKLKKKINSMRQIIMTNAIKLVTCYRH